MKKILTILLISVLALTACGKKTEKERFIEATVDVTCMIFEADDLNAPDLEEKTKEVFADYGFDVDNEAEMQEIAARYENDSDVKAAVEEALKDCSEDVQKFLDNLTEKVQEEGADSTKDDGTESEVNADEQTNDENTAKPEESATKTE